MAYSRPTLDEIVNDLRTAFRAAFVTAGRPLEAFVRNTVPWVLTRVWGDALHNLYGLLAYAHRQILPSTAGTEWLELHAADYGMARLPASPSSGSLLFVGTNGTSIPLGTPVVRTDGIQYVTTEAATVLGVSVFATAVCSTSGSVGNAEDGASLSLVTPIAGIASVKISGLSDGWKDGADIETDEALRERVLLRLQRPPQGGSATDYNQWARLVVGVQKVWIVPLGRGANTVDVYFLHAEGTGFGIPTSGQVADVQAVLDVKRPVTTSALALAPTEVPVAFTLEISPDTADNRAAIEAELDALFLLRAGSGLPIYLSDYWAAITAPIGAGLDSVSMTVPASTTTVAVGEVATRGTITWL